MPSVRAVVDYTGLNLYEVLDLPCDMFKLCLKHATIEKLSQTEEGRKYLADCERMKVTTPDFKAIKTKING